MAIDATERFFEDLRNDIGNNKFDRLFSINPTHQQLDNATKDIASQKRFHFLSSTLSIGLSTSDLSFQEALKQRLENILSMLSNGKHNDVPTLDISDMGITIDDANIHSNSLFNEKSKRQQKRHRYHH
jgi:hypothetical protein